MREQGKTLDVTVRMNQVRTTRSARRSWQSLASLSFCAIVVAAPSVSASDSGASTSREALEASIARLEQATQVWERSCHESDSTGLCVELVPVESSPSRCVSPRLGEVRVLSRKAKLADKAQRALDQAIDHAQSLAAPSDPALQDAHRAALERAQLARADGDLERYLALRMPADLDFIVEEWKRDSQDAKDRKEYERQVTRRDRSQAAFKRYFDDKTSQSAELLMAYARLRGPAAVEAAQRTAWVSLSFADQLESAAVPSAMKSAEQRAAYCSALADHAEAPHRVARDAATVCVEAADRLGVTNAATEACKVVLGVLPKP